LSVWVYFAPAHHLRNLRTGMRIIEPTIITDIITSLGIEPEKGRSLHRATRPNRICVRV
jgi:hypothetical protein